MQVAGRLHAGNVGSYPRRERRLPPSPNRSAQRNRRQNRMRGAAGVRAWTIATTQNAARRMRVFFNVFASRLLAPSPIARQPASRPHSLPIDPVHPSWGLQGRGELVPSEHQGEGARRNRGLIALFIPMPFPIEPGRPSIGRAHASAIFQQCVCCWAMRRIELRACMECAVAFVRASRDERDTPSQHADEPA